jgi:antitoxin component HigA of HigAB toxin-antitoxin module
MDFMAILNQLREAVERDKRPHSQIAAEAGSHPKTFSAFMHGRRGLSVETVEQLAKALHFSIRLVRLKN